MNPTPSPFVVDKYSRSSAGYFAGTPIVTLLHSYYHAETDDFSPQDEGYINSLIGVFVSLFLIGMIFLCVMFCFNCFACCQCCRKKLKCCFFNIFHENVKIAKITVIILLLLSASISMFAYFGRIEFDDGVYRLGDQLRYLGSLFEQLSDETSTVIEQGVTYLNASFAINCDDPNKNENFQTTSEQMEDVGEGLEDLLDGIGAKMVDLADQLEAEVPPRINLMMTIITCMIWVNVLAGVFAISTKCMWDDYFMIAMSSLALFALILVVAAQVTVAVSVGDFCYKKPTVFVRELAGSNEILDYYLTCNGTSPFASYFDDARDYVSDFRVMINNITDDDNCLDRSIDTISDTTYDTTDTIDDCESLTGCSSINPYFTEIFQNAVCDELVKGLFYTFMARAAGALLLFFAMMVFPCASHTEPKFKSPRHMVKTMSTSGIQFLSRKSSVNSFVVDREESITPLSSCEEGEEENESQGDSKLEKKTQALPPPPPSFNLEMKKLDSKANDISITISD